jgi:sugar phosphate isomerase/epimerase
MYEEVRKKIGGAGFEYVLLMDQDPQKINQSVIGGKIPAVHAPFPAFGHISFGQSLFLIELITNLIYGKNRIPDNFEIISEKTFRFAKAVGAKVAVFHTYSFDHQRIPENLARLAEMEEKFSIRALIEHEGNYVDTWMKNWKEFKKVDGAIDWMIKPEKLIGALDKFYPRKKFQICLDTSSLYGYELPIIDTAAKVWTRVGHLHLAGSQPGIDLAAEIDQPEIALLAEFFYDHDYKGLINAEVNGTNNKPEEWIADIYGASAILRVPILKKQFRENTQRHFENSCRYLLRMLS